MLKRLRWWLRVMLDPRLRREYRTEYEGRKRPGWGEYEEREAERLNAPARAILRPGEVVRTA